MMRPSSTQMISVLMAVCGLSVTGCATYNKEGTLGSLNSVDIEIKEEVIVGSLEKALESYQRYLDETPETAMTPEAIRRLADLKIEKEYSAAAGYDTSSPVVEATQAAATTPVDSTSASSDSAVAAQIKAVHSPQPDNLTKPGTGVLDVIQAESAIMAGAGKEASSKSGAIADLSESEKEFNERATREQNIKTNNSPIASPTGKAEDLQVAGAMEAIELYKGLLKKYPLYERNDQVMYQLSRAYEEIGQVEKPSKP